jgi:hypothetical protein
MPKKNQDGHVTHMLASIFTNLELETTRWREPIAQIFTDVAANLRYGTDPEEVAIICEGAAEMIRNPASAKDFCARLLKELGPQS